MKIKTKDGVFESVREAAKFYKVTPGAVYQALSRGNIDGLGRGHRRIPGTTGLARKNPFKMAGGTWPSMLQCSRETGIPYSRFLDLRPSHFKRYTPETRIRKLLELERDISAALRPKRRELKALGS